MEGFGAAGEDVVDDVVVFFIILVLVVVEEGDGVLDYGGVVGWEVEVSCGECVDYGVDFDDCCIDAVGDEGGGGGSYAEAAVCGMSAAGFRGGGEV